MTTFWISAIVDRAGRGRGICQEVWKCNVRQLWNNNNLLSDEVISVKPCRRAATVYAYKILANTLMRRLTLSPAIAADN
jgi:hypothetical protein